MSDQDSESLRVRLTELETRYTHLHRLTEELNQVVVAQARRLDQLEHRVANLTGHLQTLNVRFAEIGTPDEEKPPHY